MSQEYDDDAQTGEDGGATGPGAPTPLSALEVSLKNIGMRCSTGLMCSI